MLLELLFKMIRAKEMALSEINQDFWYFYGVNRWYFLFRTPNSGKIKTKPPPKIWIWMWECQLLGRFAPSQLSSLVENFLCPRVILLSFHKGHTIWTLFDISSFFHCVTLSFLTMLCTHASALSLLLRARAHHYWIHFFRCREQSKRIAYVR